MYFVQYSERSLIFWLEGFVFLFLKTRYISTRVTSLRCQFSSHLIFRYKYYFYWFLYIILTFIKNTIIFKFYTVALPYHFRTIYNYLLPFGWFFKSFSHLIAFFFYFLSLFFTFYSTFYILNRIYMLVYICFTSLFWIRALASLATLIHLFTQLLFMR